MLYLPLKPVLTPDPNKLDEAYEVLADVERTWDNQIIRVPKFFQYDGASIPPALYQIIGTPFHPRLMIPAVVHDWIYHVHTIARKRADDLCYDMLLKCGVGSARSWLIYKAMRSVGEDYWGNDDDDRAYIELLKNRILNDGREPGHYGIHTLPLVQVA